MPYKYVAYGADRNVVEGVLDVTTEDLAKTALRRLGYNVLSLKSSKPAFSFRKQLPSLFGVKPKDVIAFTRQLATLLERGTNLLNSLELLKSQIGKIAFNEVIKNIIEDIKQGSAFSEAVARHPAVFPMIYSRMITVSEQAGNLEQVLRQIANYMEKEGTLRKKVTRAMMYPSFILLVATVVIIILVNFTLPPMLEMFTQFDVPLPITTKVLMWAVGFFDAYKLYLAMAVVLLIVFFLWYRKTPQGRARLDTLKLKIPLIGVVNIRREMAHFASTMSMSMEAGLPMHDTLTVIIQTTMNTVARQAIVELREKVMNGRGISQPLSEHWLFPSLLVQMVKMGEQSGTLSKELINVAQTYEEEVDVRINSLVSVLQPAIMVFLAGVVGFIAISVITPMYAIMGAV